MTFYGHSPLYIDSNGGRTQTAVNIIKASSHENLSSGFPTKRVSNQSPQTS